jgi:hypothetical protein
VLFTEALNEAQEKTAIDFLKNIESSGCDAGFHIYNQPTRLQKFISRNTDGILIIPSDYPHVSVWIPRILNSSLVSDTINSFDLEFANGIDVIGGSS